MSTLAASKIAHLKQRAAMLKQARCFFDERGLFEVDTPALSQAAPIDRHIDVMRVEVSPNVTGYLHTSPEYAMKRLLAAGAPDIYYLGHTFRQDESGRLHNPEFTMAEWYRLGFSFEEMIEETLQFCHLFLGEQPSSKLSYQEAWKRYTGQDPFLLSDEELRFFLQQRIEGLSSSLLLSDRDTLLQMGVSLLIEPHLGNEELTVLYGFPASQAALAKTVGDKAQRFELYYRGIELANGYEELSDAEEQKQRFHQALADRDLAGKALLPIDERFLAALKEGLPPCCGVAVGFDRLLQLQLGAATLAEVIPFAWPEA